MYDHMSAFIHDTEHAIPNLFKKYMQVSADHARKYGGTGLGLAICKQLVTSLSKAVLVCCVLRILPIFIVPNRED